MANNKQQAQSPTNGALAVQSVQYSTAFGDVELSAQTVRDYLVRGSTNVSDQEVKLFLELCKFQKLNPFTNEVYLIKFGSNPAQMVVGRDAYLRRAYENPDYLGFQSGIVVTRGDQIVQKEGTCPYPTEVVIGGWCRVRRKLNGEVVETFKEVALSEYNLKQSNWNTKPGLMISKVAESQALRAAFPTDYAGLYTAEEAGPGGAAGDYIEGELVPPPSADDPVITKEQRQQLFDKAKTKFGERANEMLSEIISEFGFTSTTEMPTSVWNEVMICIENWQDVGGADEPGDEGPPSE